MKGVLPSWRGARIRLGAYAERRLVLASPARRQRFGLVLGTVRGLCERQRVHLLDAGCGDGLLTEAVARKNPTWQVVGLDSSAVALARAVTRTTASRLENIRFVEGDLTESLGESVYDVILAVECLEEIEADRRAVQSLATALSPGGFLIVHVPQKDWSPVLRGSPTRWRHEVRHGYSDTELVALLEATGLAVVEVRGTYRRLVQLMQEFRDRIKTRPTWLRSFVFPLMVLAVRLEGVGLTWGPDQALFAVAVRNDSHAGTSRQAE